MAKNVRETVYGGLTQGEWKVVTTVAGTAIAASGPIAGPAAVLVGVGAGAGTAAALAANRYLSSDADDHAA